MYSKHHYPSKYIDSYMCIVLLLLRTEEQTSSEEEAKAPQTNRRYFGLRRQGRNNPLPVVMTSTPTEVKPVVMTTPSEMEPEAKMAKLEEDEDEEQDNQDEGSDEQEEDSSSSIKEEEEEQNEEDVTEEESDKPKDKFPVVNHYYTYHNYGPQHARHGMVHTSSQTTGKVDDSSSSSSESSSSEEEKEGVKKVEKKKKNRGLLKRLPSPINIFFRFLKNLRPNKPKIIIRTNGQGPATNNDNGARAKASGVTFVKLFLTKKGRKNNIDVSDRISPFSPLASFRLPHRSNPLSDIFHEPEPRHASFMEPPMHQHQHSHSYNSGPFNPGPMDYHPNSHNYQQPPPPEPMTSRFNGNPPMYPMDNLLWPSPSIDFIPPWNPMFNQEPSMPIAPPGEKNLACGKPVKEGLCLDRMSVPRWFYDQRRGVCDIFYYTGCGGNENRFDSYKQCHDVCMGKCCQNCVKARPKYCLQLAISLDNPLSVFLLPVEYKEICIA